MSKKITEEIHKYLDSKVHAYCDYHIYEELKDLVFDIEQSIEDIVKPNTKL